MRKRIPIKNHQQEIHLIANRSVIGLCLMGALIVLLIIRLFYLQIYKNDIYSTLSTKNWLDLVPVEPTRGLIYDRNGVLLAENIPVFSLDVIPVKTVHLPITIQKLRTLITLSDDDLHQFQKQLKQHRRFDEVPLKLRLTEEEVARFIENQHRFPGFVIKARLIRHYPFGERFSHVLGYVGRINSQELNEIDTINYSASYYIGKLGIEKYYEKMLHGQVGYQQVENDASGQPIRILKEIKTLPGKNLHLTLDSDLQFIAEKALGEHRGAVVAIEPATGQVLSLVSKPGYDPNLFVLGISKSNFKALQESDQRPLFNRALRGLYPPASTLKPYIALGALENNIITAEQVVRDAGTFQLKNNSHRYHDWTPLGHGDVNVARAILVSCDVFFYDLANKMGIELIDETLKNFGFGGLTQLDIEEELPGILASPLWKLQMRGVHWYEGDTIISGIGQGFMQATPLQIAHATAMLATRGKRFLPYLLLGEQLPGGELITHPPKLLTELKLKPAHWELVIEAMEGVINNKEGTAYKLYGKKTPYSIAAKTGTGQVVSKRTNPNEMDNQSNLPEKLRDHHLFMAFAPVDHPKIALVVVTENDNSAIKVAREIFDYYLGSGVKSQIQKIPTPT